MAKCPNKNTAEYKALQSVYKTEIATNNIINRWASCAKIRDFEGKKSELIRLMSDYKDRT